ncbi:uncharacterized protein LOC122506626 [Leptopilina heterotoma]|uniref:uncharacterized protein LOC122506626 n=1 Tax=Leptopilina heterotoma TaxID=63436 RepID=UPI001CA8FE4F|nr:uncharacterized protein LOC122506626 [Leptopilina heterotoma]
MDNTTISILHTTNFQFLSVCHYITSFGLFFYNQNLIPLENRNHSVSVLNTFFDYIHNLENASSTKLELLQRVLAGSDLYGGGENETLDMKYVEETFQYIISSALFSHYGNIQGYLAGIISRAENITYTELKKNVLQQFSKNYKSQDYCSSRKESIQLTSIAIQSVFNQNIWSMFPEPEETIEIMDVNYIYAMIGLKIARSVPNVSTNLPFNGYILLSQEFEFQTTENKSYQLTLELFKTPALFYYAYVKKDYFRKDEISTLMKRDKFWQRVYKTFFRFLHRSLKIQIRGEIKKSHYFKLKREMQEIKNRTFIAAEIIKKLCNYSNIDEVPSNLISIYKTSEWMFKFIIARECNISRRLRLPDLEEIFNSQFDTVRDIFNQVEQNSLDQILLDGKLIEKMNSNSTVQFASVPHHDMHCMYCAPWPRKMNSDIYLMFTITENEEKNFYAIRQENNTLTLLSNSGNESEFSRAVANDSTLRMEVQQFSRYLKYRDEDYKVFVQRVADIKTEQFVQGLKKHYRNPTSGEKIIDFVKSLVPFYTCIENINSGHQGAAAFSCSLDIFSLLPIAGVAAKYSSIMWRSLIAKIGPQTLWSLSRSTFNKLTISTGLDLIHKIVFKTLTREILTKQLLIDISIASLRTLDPGFELSFKFLRFSNQVFRKIYRMLSSKFGSIPKIKNLLQAFESAMRLINRNAELLPDGTGLIPKIIQHQNDYNIVRYIYPGGTEYFGPKCLTAFGKTAELRTIEGNRFQVPVVSSKSGNSVYYGELDLKSGQVSTEKLKIGRDDILRKIGNYIDEAIVEGRDVNVLRNYHVYHNTIELYNQPNKGGSNTISNPLVDQRNLIVDSETSGTSSRQLANDDIARTYRGDNIAHSTSSFRYFYQTDIDRTINLLKDFKEKGLLGLNSDKNLALFRRILNSMDSYQLTKNAKKPPVDLWLTQEITRPSIVNTLKNLKGKEFYFNDLTLLTDVNPTDIITNKLSKTPLKTEVRYHIHFNSHYGLLDLGAFHDTIKNQYIVFPQLEFEVIDTQYFNGKDYLVLELKQKILSKEEWSKFKDWDTTVPARREILQSTRADSIERAALFVSSNTPLKRFSETEQFLKQYILRIDDNLNSVFTYDTLANDIYAGGTIPEKYNQWKIDNNMFIDDILFQKSLHQVDTLKSAELTINNIFGGIYKQEVRPVFEIYHNSPEIRHLLRFEDYYVIYSFITCNLLSDIHALKRVDAAIRRLALRQFDEQSSKNSKIIYRAVNLSLEKFSGIINLKTGADFKFPQMQEFHSNQETVLSNCRDTRTSEKLVLFEVKATNMAGIADISAVVSDPTLEYYISEEIQLTIVNRRQEVLQGRDVFTVTLQNDKQPIETRMVELIKELDKILASGTKFYVDM